MRHFIEFLFLVMSYSVSRKFPSNKSTRKERKDKGHGRIRKKEQEISAEQCWKG
jgi:hypothetical protein